jgi:hypothetical protein
MECIPRQRQEPQEYRQLVTGYARALVDLNEHTMSWRQTLFFVRLLNHLEGMAAESAGSGWDQNQFDSAVLAAVDAELVALGIT